MATTEYRGLTFRNLRAHNCVVNLRQPPPSRIESAEGAGIARRKWFQFLSGVPKDALDASGIMDPSIVSFGGFTDEHRKMFEKRAKEDSELLGFWLTWHVAGGFDELEKWGWHRATIYRKIKRFRERYGAHPDEYNFNWIKLDLKRAWSDSLILSLGGEVKQ